jgi:hypothetical protein
LFGVYVDDIITIGKEKMVEEFRADMIDHFKMTDEGKLEWYLGIAFDKREDGVETMDQSQYLKNKLNKFEKFIGPGGASTLLSPNYKRILIDAEKEDPINYQFSYRQMIGMVHGTDTITLFEHIFGSKPKLDRLYPFGCVCYGHVPKESRKKLDPTGIECRLIGYGDQDESTQMKGFKLLEIATNKIHFLRDFVFDTVTEPNQFADYEYLKPNDPEFFHDSR